MLEKLEKRLASIESKLDALLDAVADEAELVEVFDLDGIELPRERNPLEPL